MKNNVLFNSSTFLPRARYLCIFILAFVFGIGQMWAATETEPSSVPAKDNAIEGTSYSINSTYNAGAGGTKVGSMPTNGVKFRTNRESQTKIGGSAKSNSIEFSVKSGYKITGITLVGVTNTNDKAATIGSIYIDGTEYETSFNGNLPAKNSTTASNVVVSGIEATSSVIFVFSDLNSTTQANICYTVTYEAVVSTSYTITYNANGGSGSMGNSANTVSACGFTAPASKEFKEWNTAADGSGDSYAAGATASSDLDLYAIWQDHVASSNANLSALSVAGCTLNEDFAPATTAYTVTIPFYGSMPVVGDVTATKDDVNAATPNVSIAGNVITVACEAEDGTTKNYTITVSIAGVPTASSSINIEQLVLDNGKGYDIATALTAANIVVDGTNGLDSLNDGKTARNYPYLGLKFKKKDADIIKIVVPANSVLNVRFGNVGVALTTTVNGVAGASVAKASSGSFHLDAVDYVREVVFNSSDAQTVTLQQVKIGADVDAITLPWKVTYDAGTNGTCAKASEVWFGSALTLPNVTANSGYNFTGWNDGVNDYLAGGGYTPTANVTLTAQYTMDVEDRLEELEFAGEALDGFDPDQQIYYTTVPYSVALPQITGAVAKDEEGGAVATIQETFWDDEHGYYVAQAYVTPAGGGDPKFYQIRFTMDPKDGVCLVWSDATGNNAMTVDVEKSLFAATATASNTKSTSEYGGKTGYKFNSRPASMSVTLSGTETFQAGDVVEVFVTTVTDDYMRVFDANDNTDEHILAEGAVKMVQGVNRLILPATSTNSLYLLRGAADAARDMWNPYIAYIAVYRSMNPILTAITINGREGEIDALDNKHFNVTIPYDANLASLTVEPSIVRCAEHATTPEQVTTNAGAWVIGNNTYRIMDKYGDYTDYTITLTRDVLKHTVSFNTHGGSAVDDEEVEHNEYLAAAPTAPTKEDYIFQYWSLSDGGAEVDVTTVQISKDTTFHAVWAADGATKLLDGATVNHTDFITGVTATETVEFNGEDRYYVKFSGTVSGVNGVKDLTRVIAYNAKTNKTKIQISAHNNSTSARSILVKGLVEGADAAVDLATIDLGNKEDKVSDWIEFDNAANRTIYIFVGSSAGDVYFTQVKVIESGTALKKAGEIGYSLNFNKGRFFGVKSTTREFEGLSVGIASSDCQPLNTSVVKLASSSMSFYAAEPVTLTVTTNNSNTYYVTKDAAGTDNETAKKGASKFYLTAGEWYVTGGTSNVEITNIAFTETPVITYNANGGTGSMSTSVGTVSDNGFTAPSGKAFTGWNTATNGSGEGYEAGDVVDASVTLYAQWADIYTVTYKANGGTGDDVVDNNATTIADNTFTAPEGMLFMGWNTAANGSGANYEVGAAVTGTLTLYAQWEAPVVCCTLIPATSGAALNVGDVVAMQDESEGGVITIVAKPENFSYAANGLVFGSGSGTKAKVTLDNIMKKGTVIRMTLVANGDKTRGLLLYNGAGDAKVDAFTCWVENVNGATSGAEETFAYTVTDGDGLIGTNTFQLWRNNTVTLKSLTVTNCGQEGAPAEIAFADANIGKKSDDAAFTNTLTNAAGLTVSYTSSNTAVATVGSDGEVTIVGVGTATISAYAFAQTKSDVFYKTASASYTLNVYETARTIAEEKVGSFGTFCPDKAVVAFRGVTFYELAGGLGESGHPTMLIFNEVDHLIAGMPYLFVSESTSLEVIYEGDAVSEAGHYNGFYGTLEPIVAAPENELTNNFMMVGGVVKKCGANCSLAAGRGYFKMEEVTCRATKEECYELPGASGTQNPAPNRRHVALNNASTNQATGLEYLTEDGVTGKAVEGCFDVLGRKVAEPQQNGVYILNGKKVVIVK